MPAHKESITLSVIITAHAEGILLHRTLRSVQRATGNLGTKYSHEIILHIDNPTDDTSEYVALHRKSTLKDVRVLVNAFGDLGASRNFAIREARGTYIATVDGDDLMSANWLRNALDLLAKTSEPTIAHSEFTVEFEGADSLIIKHGEIDRATDTLLSVYANRWNSIVVAPRKLLLEETYQPNNPGYGYEDWNLNSRLIYRGVHNVLVPETAIFVRRKRTNSEWQRQISSMAVLRANPLLSLSHVRSLPNPFPSAEPAAAPMSPARLRSIARRMVTRYPLTHRVARRVRVAIKRQHIHPSSMAANKIPAWLEREWQALHAIDRQIFLSESLKRSLPTYDTLTPEHKLAGSLYKQIADSLHFDSYDYLIFVPWLVKGGADKVAINYANTIQALRPHKRVLVVATLPYHSPWQENLSNDVDFLDFGNITRQAPMEIKIRLMEHIIENTGVTHLHVINSEFGYDFVQLHKTYLDSSKKKVVATSFSQSIDSTGRVFGYSHTHVPFVYDMVTLITSDNQAVVNMWDTDYGFDTGRMAVHHQPVALDTIPTSRQKPGHLLRVLWAARIAPEKQPQLLHAIGTGIQEFATMDIYGSVEPGQHSAIENLPKNVQYKGSFDGLDSLPLHEYDVLLYTSLFDGMPNTLLEAAAAKLPIVASGVGGIPEFIRDSETGLLITDISTPRAYTQALKRLFDEPQLGNTLADNAYAKLQTEFSQERYEDSVRLMLDRLDY